MKYATLILGLSLVAAPLPAPASDSATTAASAWMGLRPIYPMRRSAALLDWNGGSASGWAQCSRNSERTSDVSADQWRALHSTKSEWRMDSDRASLRPHPNICMDSPSSAVQVLGIFSDASSQNVAA